jgi:hypothetical protein
VSPRAGMVVSARDSLWNGSTIAPNVTEQEQARHAVGTIINFQSTRVTGNCYNIVQRGTNEHEILQT